MIITKLAVIGSRDYLDRKFVFEILSRFIKKYPSVRFIVSGGAVGPDLISESFARKNNLSRLIFRPEYKKHGKSATFKRNFEIIDSAEYVIAFQKNKSKGTQHSIEYALKKKLPIVVFNENHKVTKSSNIPDEKISVPAS